jgi:hypothetical protein
LPAPRIDDDLAVHERLVDELPRNHRVSVKNGCEELTRIPAACSLTSTTGTAT